MEDSDPHLPVFSSDVLELKYLSLLDNVRIPVLDRANTLVDFLTRNP